MNTNDKANPGRDGAVEIDEAQLKQVAGGASDYLLEIDGVKGESKGPTRPPPLPAPGALRL